MKAPRSSSNNKVTRAECRQPDNGDARAATCQKMNYQHRIPVGAQKRSTQSLYLGFHPIPAGKPAVSRGHRENAHIHASSSAMQDHALPVLTQDLSRPAFAARRLLPDVALTPIMIMVGAVEMYVVI